MSRIAISTLAVACAMTALAAAPTQAQVGTNGGRPIAQDDRWARPGDNQTQGWGGDGWGNGRSSITVYRDAWYQGQSQSFSGEVRDLRNSSFNDQISSMRFEGRWEACTDGDFRGQCQTFSENVGDLVRFGINDRISSLRPVRGGGGGNGGGWGGAAASITVYRDADFQGSSSSFNSEVVDLRPLGFNDEISSVRLRGSWEVCEDSYFRGRCQVIDNDIRTLRDLGLNDKISSMRPARRGGGGW